MDKADGGVRLEGFVELCDGFCQNIGEFFLNFDRRICQNFGRLWQTFGGLC